MQDFIFQRLLLQNKKKSASHNEDGPPDTLYLFYLTQVQLIYFPTHVLWMDIWTQTDIFQHLKPPHYVFIVSINIDTPAHPHT